jgi:flagellar motor protein MotB
MRQEWQRRRTPVAHTDDWLMTYADMITLLLCFFAIFLSVSIPKKDVQQKAHIPQPIEQPSHLPDVLKGNLPFYGLPHAQQAGDDTSDDTSVETAKKIPESFPDSIAPLKLTDRNDVVADVISVQAFDKITMSLLQIVNRLKVQGPASIEQKGDRITTLAINSAAFFDSGSATLSQSGKSILQDVAVNIKSDKFKGYQVTVEGHTDDSPIHTPQFPSNWELSTARAAAVVRFLLDDGVPAQQLRAAGYADTFPVAPNRDAKRNPILENQARNRRVVIKLEKIEKTE